MPRNSNSPRSSSLRLGLDGVRDEDLAASGRLADARGLVHGQAHEAAAGCLNAPSVQPHPHADARSIGPGLGGERQLCGDGSRDRPRGVDERGEELVAAPVDDGASVGGDRGFDQRPVALEHLAVLIPELAQDARRALDVREQEGAVGGHRYCRSSPGQVSERR